MAGGWTTTFTLKIDFETQTFAPSSKKRPDSSNLAKARCTCSQLDQIHPSARLADFKRGLFPSRRFIAHFVFMVPGKLAEAERLCEVDQNREHHDLNDFCLWMLSLVAQLSDLCDADHSFTVDRVETSFNVRPFKEGKILKSNVCKQVCEIIQNPLAPSEAEAHGMGYVYVLRAQSCMSTITELKIGFSKYHPEHRSHELASCLARPEVICHTPLLPHAKRIESIIHGELHACRKVQSCYNCNRNHQEWFTISHADAREVVTRWGKWMIKQPYVDGRLTADWKAHLAKEDLQLVTENTSLSDFWTAWIDSYLATGTKKEQSQRIGEYLNNCNWNFTIAQFGLGQYGKAFCNDLRAELPRGRNKRGLTSHDMMESLRKLARTYGELSESEDQSVHSNPDEMLMDSFGQSRVPPGLNLDQRMPINQIFRKDSRIASLYHSETRWQHLMTVNRSAGTLTRLVERAKEYEKAQTEDIPGLINAIQNLKTGVMSVSDPVLGVTESPLGDATLLPVFALKDVKYLNGNVANWVGMNPTHYGFQLLQEAYQEGKWIGNAPQFRLPKAFRKAGITRLPTDGEHTIVMEEKPATKKPQSDTGLALIRPATFRLTRDQGKDTFQVGLGVTEDQQKALEEALGLEPQDSSSDEQLQRINSRAEELCARGELGWLQKSAAKSIQKLGLGLKFDFSSDDDVGSSDVSSCSSGSADEDTFGDRAAASVPPLDGSRKRAAGSGSVVDGIDRKEAKLWLESL